MQDAEILWFHDSLSTNFCGFHCSVDPWTKFSFVDYTDFSPKTLKHTQNCNIITLLNQRKLFPPKNSKKKPRGGLRFMAEEPLMYYRNYQRVHRSYSKLLYPSIM